MRQFRKPVDQSIIMNIIHRMHITGMSVVAGGRRAGGSMVTTGIIGHDTWSDIDICDGGSLTEPYRVAS